MAPERGAPHTAFPGHRKAPSAPTHFAFEPRTKIISQKAQHAHRDPTFLPWPGKRAWCLLLLARIFGVRSELLQKNSHSVIYCTVCAACAVRLRNGLLLAGSTCHNRLPSDNSQARLDRSPTAAGCGWCDASAVAQHSLPPDRVHIPRHPHALRARFIDLRLAFVARPSSRTDSVPPPPQPYPKYPRSTTTSPDWRHCARLRPANFFGLTGFIDDLSRALLSCNPTAPSAIAFLPSRTRDRRAGVTSHPPIHPPLCLPDLPTHIPYLHISVPFAAILAGP